MKLIIGVMLIVLLFINVFSGNPTNDIRLHSGSEPAEGEPQPRVPTVQRSVYKLPAQSRAEPVVRMLIMTATAYFEKGITKSGVPSGPGKVAVDPKIIPLGTKLWIENYGPAVAVDTGKFIKGNRVDVWIETKKECLEWGRKQVKVYVYN